MRKEWKTSKKRAQPAMAIAENSPAKGAPQKTKGNPTVSNDDRTGDRATKINELKRKLERLESLIEGVKEEFKERAMEDAGAGAIDPICNTCLVRKRGAALYPCGHTFCWKCTFDLRHGRGPCPICNHYFWNVVTVGQGFPIS